MDGVPTKPDDEPRQPPSDDSRRAQLALLQTRVGVHGGRLWQLPMTYFGLIVLAISSACKDDGPDVAPDLEFFDISTLMVFGPMTALGFILFCCMWGALEGYLRTAKHMVRLENELGLTPSTHAARSHYIPYFCMIILGTLISFVALFVLG